MGTWSTPTSIEQVHRRASGRRRYNSVRQLRAQLRAVQALRLMAEYSWVRGAQTRIAAELGVHRSTISRDLAKIPAPPDESRCPFCGAVQLTDEVLDVIAQRSDEGEARIKQALDHLVGPAERVGVADSD